MTFKANLDLHVELTEQAVAASADLVIFPELGLTGYLLKDLVPEVAMSLDDKRLNPLLDLSRQVDIVTGMVLKSDDFRYYNAAVYMTGGEVTHVHRKVYLPTYGMFDEQRYFAAGDRVRSFDVAGVRAGVLVCEDMWHLSTAYLLFVQGVSLLLCISASPGRGVLANADADVAPGSVGSWNDLLRTVAEYTTSYVAYCNRLGYEDGVNFWGGSWRLRARRPAGEGGGGVHRAAARGHRPARGRAPAPGHAAAARREGGVHPARAGADLE